MKPKNTGETTAGNQSVAKALRILQVFTQENPYLRLKDISALAGKLGMLPGVSTKTIYQKI